MNKSGELIMEMLVFREAIASVSLSHEPACNCKTCKAAKGDENAILELWYMVKANEK